MHVIPCIYQRAKYVYIETTAGKLINSLESKWTLHMRNIYLSVLESGVLSSLIRINSTIFFELGYKNYGWSEVSMLVVPTLPHKSSECSHLEPPCSCNVNGYPSVTLPGSAELYFQNTEKLMSS